VFLRIFDAETLPVWAKEEASMNASDPQIPRLPASLPVMVLGGAALLPHNSLPLFIFEPRYRAMLELALQTDRLLAIATPCNQDGSEVL
jgi:Lon protease-like protein